MVDFVAAYNTRTRRKLARTVPASWIGSPLHPDLAPVPSGRTQERPPRHRPRTPTPELSTPDADPVSVEQPPTDPPALGDSVDAAPTGHPTTADTTPPEEQDA